MQLRIWAAATIFVGSYLPLSLILLAQDYNFTYLNAEFCFDFWSRETRCVLPLEHPALSISIFVFCLICFLLTLFVLGVVKPKHSIEITSAKYIPSELMNYTLPYVVSFMGVGYDEEGKFVGILIFLAWIFWITYKSGQIILNPVLVAFGWRLYEITYRFMGDDKTYNSVALLKGEPQAGGKAKHNTIQEVMVVRLELDEQETP